MTAKERLMFWQEVANIINPSTLYYAEPSVLTPEAIENALKYLREKAAEEKKVILQFQSRSLFWDICLLHGWPTDANSWIYTVYC